MKRDWTYQVFSPNGVVRKFNHEGRLCRETKDEGGIRKVLQPLIGEEKWYDQNGYVVYRHIRNLRGDGLPDYIKCSGMAMGTGFTFRIDSDGNADVYGPDGKCIISMYRGILD